MNEHKSVTTDESLAFLNKFIELFEEIIQHEGYGDISVSVRLLNRHTRLIVLGSGKEYRYQVQQPLGRQDRSGKPRFRISRNKAATQRPCQAPFDRRRGKDRRMEDRRKNREPRNFRLERRLGGDRRHRDRRGR